MRAVVATATAVLAGSGAALWAAWSWARKLLDKMVEEEYDSTAVLVGDALAVAAGRVTGSPEQWTEEFLSFLDEARQESGRPELPRAISIAVRAYGMRRSKLRSRQRRSPWPGLLWLLGMTDEWFRVEIDLNANAFRQLDDHVPELIELLGDDYEGTLTVLQGVIAAWIGVRSSLSLIELARGRYVQFGTNNARKFISVTLRAQDVSVEIWDLTLLDWSIAKIDGSVIPEREVWWPR